MADARTPEARLQAATDPAAQQAIERVLEAERAAREAVALCEAEGESIVAEARLHARRIAERADARIAALRALSRARLDEALARLDAEAQALAARPLSSETQRRMEAAVDALAARLSGEAS